MYLQHPNIIGLKKTTELKITHGTTTKEWITRIKKTHYKPGENNCSPCF